MKQLVIFVIAVFLTIVCVGCERMETSVDLYKKVKDDARQKAQQAQEEAQKIVKEKTKDALSPKDQGEEGESADKEE